MSLELEELTGVFIENDGLDLIRALECLQERDNIKIFPQLSGCLVKVQVSLTIFRLSKSLLGSTVEAVCVVPEDMFEGVLESAPVDDHLVKVVQLLLLGLLANGESQLVPDGSFETGSIFRSRQMLRRCNILKRF